MSWLTNLLDYTSELEPARRAPYAMEPRDGGVVAFRRRTVPTAIDKPRVAPGLVAAWIVGGLAVIAAINLALINVFGWTPFFDRLSLLWERVFVTLVVEQGLRWLLVPLAAVTLLYATLRHRRRPREIVFDPGPRELRISPGRTILFSDISGVHAITIRDPGPEEPLEHHRVYVRLGNERITLAEFPTRREADDLAERLRRLVAG